MSVCVCFLRPHESLSESVCACVCVVGCVCACCVGVVHSWCLLAGGRVYVGCGFGDSFIPLCCWLVVAATNKSKWGRLSCGKIQEVEQVEGGVRDSV